ncbi:MAG: hypothetical protein HY925_01985 [Elusimicrobia bacterium]|nr:hypothetical protein [Elusimicrobiota bacterium]
MNLLPLVVALFVLPARAQVKGIALPEAASLAGAGAAAAGACVSAATNLSANLSLPALVLPRQARVNSVAGGVIRAFGTAASEQEVAGAAAAHESGLAHPESPTVVDKNGHEHPVSYLAGARQESLASIVVRGIRELPEKLLRIRRFAARVDDLLEGVTDEQLSWSFNRLDALVSQEGILRSDNTGLINKWTDREQLKNVSHADFAESSIEPVSVMKMFKATMDMEQPTLQYQYAFAQSLHNRMPRMSHFLGTTFQERVLQVALKGKPGQMAIWSNEEVRHGPILEAVYNHARFPGMAKLEQQGAAPRLPRAGTEYVAKSGMSNRSLAELGASGAYLTLKANAIAGSPTDKAMDGVYRDEVYHHVIMSAVNRFVLGYQSRWKRLYLIFRHDLDFRPHGPNDRVRHYRRPFSPLMVLEYAYAMNQVDKRVNRFLDTLNPEEARRIIGPYYRTDAQVQQAVDAGEHSWTKLFPMEVNPALTKADVEKLIQRQPRNFSMERRAVKASELKEVLDGYRATSLNNPNYWLRKKGFTEIDEGTLTRTIEGGSIALQFGAKGGPQAAIFDSNDVPRWSDWIGSMSFPQIGALIDAESIADVRKIQAAGADLDFAELLKRLSNNPAYQKDPIALIRDLPRP